MKNIEFGREGDNVTVKVDGKQLRTPFNLKNAKDALKKGGPALIDMAMKHFRRKLEDDPVAILQKDDLDHIIKHARKSLEESL